MHGLKVRFWFVGGGGVLVEKYTQNCLDMMLLAADAFDGVLGFFVIF